MEISRNEIWTSQTLRALLNEVFELQQIGKYAQALDLLSKFWVDISELPEVSAFNATLAAETYLRCGSVLSFLGYSKQVLNAQENARNLLSIARSKYLQIYKPEKIAEAENYLAITYYNKGEYKEAAVWVEQSLSHTIAANSETRLYSYVIKSLILLAESDFHSVISYLESVQRYFEKASYLYKGSFATNLSLACKNLGQLDKAIRYLSFARHCHQKSKHAPYLATVENNLAQLYKLKGKYDLAVRCAENAVSLFNEIGDRAREAFTIDTKAQILITKMEYSEAIKWADVAIDMLKYGDNTAMLSEVYLTKAQALVGSGRIAEAVIPLTEAVNLAGLSGESAAKQIADAFELSIYGRFPV